MPMAHITTVLVCLNQHITDYEHNTLRQKTTRHTTTLESDARSCQASLADYAHPPPFAWKMTGTWGYFALRAAEMRLAYGRLNSTNCCGDRWWAQLSKIWMICVQQFISASRGYTILCLSMISNHARMWDANFDNHDVAKQSPLWSSVSCSSSTRRYCGSAA